MGLGWPDETVERARARVGGALFGAAELPPFVERFAIEGPIPPAGVSARFVARDPSSGAAVVLQFLPDLHDGSHGEARAWARACSRIRHPNIVPVTEVIEHAGSVVLVMEHVHAEALRSWVERRARTVAEIIDAYLAVATALEAAHGLGLAHRGFTSDRAVRDTDGRVRVLAADLVHSARRATVRRDVASLCDALRSSLLLACGQASSDRVCAVLDRWCARSPRDRVVLLELRADLQRAL